MKWQKLLPYKHPKNGKGKHEERILRLRYPRELGPLEEPMVCRRDRHLEEP
jgi:hypothetical protein